jgi:radical SAM superfamily enzyme YgiQ (UPF0313 family)
MPVTEKPLKILFILPYDNVYRYRNAFSKSITYAPLTFTLLSALIPPEIKAEIKIVDEGIEKCDYKKLEPDIVGLTAVTSAAKRAYDLCKYFKDRGSYVIIGGHHVTLLPDEAGEYADSVFIGSAEKTFPAFFYDYIAGQTKKFYRAESKDLSKLPWPKRELLRGKKYLKQPAFAANYGCKNVCSYCVINSFWGFDGAVRDIDDVIAEIKSLKTKEIIFYDPNQTCDRSYAIEFYHRLKELKIRWAALTDINAAFDGALLKLMAESGCIGTLIGFETFNQSSLDSVNKKITVEKFKAAIAAMHKYNISVLGTFMLGLDGDTVENLKKIPELIDEIRVDLPRFAIMTPYPNTPFFQKLDGQDRILTKDWSFYDGIHCVFRPMGMDAPEVEKLLADIFIQCFSIKRIFRRMSYVKGKYLTRLFTNIGFRIYAKKIAGLIRNSHKTD